MGDKSSRSAASSSILQFSHFVFVSRRQPFSYSSLADGEALLKISVINKYKLSFSSASAISFAPQKKSAGVFFLAVRKKKGGRKEGGGLF